ncbi:hypothetical protein CPB86DRAFT_785632 [Serendipita vermifera]|nr:hypothetical protein CPB86DRAFT_785632 [Serendipita vermifera]
MSSSLNESMWRPIFSIVVNNRDEFLGRPTHVASIHHFGKKCYDEGDAIISGLDEKGGGTWLGINRHGRIAMLTNITEEARTRNTSRGNLVSDFLLSSKKDTMEQHVNALTEIPTTEEERIIHRDYAGFNLLLISVAEEDGAPEPTGDGAVRRPRMALVTNSGGGGVLSARWLDEKETALHGVSNGIDGVTMHLWTKVKEGEECLKEAINAPHLVEDELCEHIFSVLSRHPNHAPHSKDELRGAIRVDPVPLNIGAGLQGWYGTRTASIILVRKDGFVLYRERDVWILDSEGKPQLGDPKNDRQLNFWLYL